MRQILMLVAVLCVGCSQKEPDNIDVSVTVGGKTVDVAAIASQAEKSKTDEPAAAEKLSAWKAKWIDSNGTLVGRGQSARMMAKDELKQIADNHGETASGKAASEMIPTIDSLPRAQ